MTKETERLVQAAKALLPWVPYNTTTEFLCEQLTECIRALESAPNTLPGARSGDAEKIAAKGESAPKPEPTIVTINGAPSPECRDALLKMASLAADQVKHTPKPEPVAGVDELINALVGAVYVDGQSMEVASLLLNKALARACIQFAGST